jgi:hypothetical protein
MPRLALIAATATVACLTLVAPATAKKVTSARVCGVSDCRDVDDGGLLAALPQGGDPTDPPSHPSGGWYRATMTIDAEGHHETFSVAAFPRESLVRWRDGANSGYVWTAMTADSARAYNKITFGLDPLPLSRLPGFHPGPAAPATADPVPVDDGFPWAWALAVVSFGAAGAAFLYRRLRRRGGFGRPGAPATE